MEICCGFDELAVGVLVQGEYCLYASGGVSAAQLRSSSCAKICWQSYCRILMHINIWNRSRRVIAYFAFTSMSPMSSYDS